MNQSSQETIAALKADQKNLVAIDSVQIKATEISPKKENAKV